MDTTINKQAPVTDEKETNKRVGQITSLVAHLLLLLIMFLPLISYQDPPPGQRGILISLGEPDVGEGDERPMKSEAEPPAAEETEEVEAEPVEEEVEKEKPKKEDKKASRDEAKKVLEDKASKERALKAEKKAKEKASEAAKAKAAKAEAERKAVAKAKAAADAKAKAEAEAKAKAEKYDKAKSEFGDLFGGNKGKTGEPGNQGNPDGDPDASNLEGISTGSAMIGGGLIGRKVKNKPKIEDRTQKEGKVVVKICVDETGKVTSAEYTQKGSTTTDSQLISAAKKGAKKYTFEPGTLDKQCGTVTIDFRLK